MGGKAAVVVAGDKWWHPKEKTPMYCEDPMFLGWKLTECVQNCLETMSFFCIFFRKIEASKRPMCVSWGILEKMVLLWWLKI